MSNSLIKFNIAMLSSYKPIQVKWNREVWGEDNSIWSDNEHGEEVMLFTWVTYLPTTFLFVCVVYFLYVCVFVCACNLAA